MSGVRSFKAILEVGMVKRAISAALLMALLQGAAWAGGLDGTHWKLRYRSATAWLPFWKADRIRFDAGLFHSSECASYGFREATYALRRLKSGQRWSSTLFNEDGERADWEGVLQGGVMKGSFTWTRPDGRVRRFSFRAQALSQPQSLPSKTSYSRS
jgi:hypothetical protein